MQASVYNNSQHMEQGMHVYLVILSYNRHFLGSMKQIIQDSGQIVINNTQSRFNQGGQFTMVVLQ